MEMEEYEQIQVRWTNLEKKQHTEGNTYHTAKIRKWER